MLCFSINSQLAHHRPKYKMLCRRRQVFFMLCAGVPSLYKLELQPCTKTKSAWHNLVIDLAYQKTMILSLKGLVL